jgi:hypothetical protein
VAPLDRDPVKEDHRHGVLQHRERRGAEEEEHQEAHAAHHVPRREHRAHLLAEILGVRRQHHLEVLAQGLQEDLGVHHVGQRHEQERQERHHRQQRVVRHGPGQEHALVAAKATEHTRKEGQDAA